MKRILVIEDNRKIALALILRLKSAGYEATTAYDALTGVNAAVKNPPDLVLLDICLPVGDGFSVAEQIRTLVGTPIPIIFITASKQPGFREKANQLGAAGYFEKPYEAEELLAAIQKALNHPTKPLDSSEFMKAVKPGVFWAAINEAPHPRRETSIQRGEVISPRKERG